MSLKTANRLIFFLAIIGMLIAGYILYTYVTGSPIVCVNQGCELVRKSKYANPFGLPMPLFGLVGYFLILILSFLKTLQSKFDKLLNFILVAISAFGFLFVSYLTLIEAFVIKAYCMWCIFSAITMTVIFIISVLTYVRNRYQRH